MSRVVGWLFVTAFGAAALAAVGIARGLFAGDDRALREDQPYAPRCVHLGTVLPGEAFRWEREATGLLLALLEGGFALLDDTTTWVGANAPPPGRPRCDRDPWQARLELGGEPEHLRAALWLCDPGDRCRLIDAEGSLNEMHALAAALLCGTADALDAQAERALTWVRPQSRDTYAQLLSGRSAAVWYGLMPGPAVEEEGQPGRDPIFRAMLVDPSMPVAEWMLARRALSRGDTERAVRQLVRGNPEGVDVVDLALADAYTRGGDPDQAVAAWSRVQEGLPGDHRVRLEHAAALVAAGRLDDARAALERLPERMLDEPRNLEVEVGWREAAGLPLHPDGLLARWQERAPDDPRPVRKRIDAMVARDRFLHALPLTRELERRGPVVAARQLRLAVAAELDAWSIAADAARLLGDEALATAIEGDADGFSGRPDLIAVDAASLVERARGELDAGEVAAAVTTLDTVLAAVPWHADALALQARARARPEGGEDRHALSVLCALRAVDPAHDGLDPTGPAALREARRCEEAR